MHLQGRISMGSFVLVVLLTASVAGLADVPIDWEAVAPLSLPRHSGTAIVVDGHVYTIGGVEYGNTMTVYGQTYDVTTGTLVEVYDPSTDTWTRCADLPYPIDMMARRAEGRIWLAAAAHGGKIYTIDVYDLASDTWTAGVARLPRPVCGLSAATIGDTIYLFGGATTTDPYAVETYVADCYAFDPETFSFDPLPPMPVARNMAVAATVGDDIYVIGGMKSPGATAC